MEGSGQMATVLHETPTNSSRRTAGSRWLRAISLVLLVIAISLEGGRCIRWFQYQLTGRVSTLGNTYYLQPGDRVITPEVIATGAWEKNQTDELRDILQAGDTFIFLEFTPKALRRSGYHPEAMLRHFHEQGYEIQFIYDDPGNVLTGPRQPRTVSIPESAFAKLAKSIEKDESYANLVIRKRPDIGPCKPRATISGDQE